MAKLFAILTFCFLLLASQETLAQIRTISNPCEIYGVVYVQTVQSRANFLVYIEEDEYLANLRVFKETNKLLANQSGIWYFSDNEGFADFSIFFVTERSKADFIIYYTNSEFFAGCVK
jgi:hypothetical protein